MGPLIYAEGYDRMTGLRRFVENDSKAGAIFCMCSSSLFLGTPLKKPQVIETREFPRIGYALIT